MPIPLLITAVTEQSLLDLIKAEIPEGKDIEYKREISVAGSEQKRKFIRGIASFANASGGDLVFGMEANDGKPVALRPLPGFDPDADVRLLRDMVRAHIQPPLLGVDFQPISIQGGMVLIIRVPRSWSPPHMVTFESDNRFYTRDANGCVLMNVPEIKGAFFSAKTIKERIQQFRFDRLSSIRSGELPFKLQSQSLAVFHALPFRSFAEDHEADLSAVTDTDMRPIEVISGYGRTFDVDGIYCNEKGQDGTCLCYTYVSRSGCVEVVTSAQLVSEHKVILNPNFEGRFIDFIPKCFALLQKSKAEAPIVIALTLLDIRDFVLYSGMRTHLGYLGMRRIQQRDLILPPVVAQNFDESAPKLLKPIFDALWNSCGLERSLNYDTAGNWSPRNWD